MIKEYLEKATVLEIVGLAVIITAALLFLAALLFSSAAPPCWWNDLDIRCP